MMASGNITQLDAASDAVFGVDGTGTLLWRPAGNVGKHSQWHRVTGPPGDVLFKKLAADYDEQGTWLWGLDNEGQLWMRRPCDEVPMLHAPEAGASFWSTE